MNHSFNVQVAERFGIEEAIIIELIYWWIHKNECEEEITMYQEDKMWCRCSADGFTKYIPYMNAQKIWRVLNSLEKKYKVIIVGNFNNKATNQTKWYTFTDEFKKDLEKVGYDFSKMKNGFFKNEKSYNNIINNLINKDNNIKDNKEKELLKNNSKKENIDFELFYGNYPLKKSRKTAEKAWSKLSLKDKKKAIEMIPDYIDDCIENNRHYQYPATYLNKATFNDQFGDKEEKEEMPAGMSSLQWNEIQKWMLDVIPRIAHLITPDMFLSFKPMVRFKSKLLSHILQDINNSDYEGDILVEFERISGTEEYLKQILNDEDTAY